MGRRSLICLLMISAFLIVGFADKPMASEAAMNFPKAEKDTSLNPGYIVIKSKEEIAYELFMFALMNIGELKFINTYEEYLDAYKKALKAVYSSDK